MLIRRAQGEDSQQLAKLIYASARRSLSCVFDITPDLNALSFLQRSLQHPEGQYGYAQHWVVELDSHLVACVCAWHDDLADSYHRQSLNSVAVYYGLSHSLNVLENSQILVDCIPNPQIEEYCIGHLSVAASVMRLGIGTALLSLMTEQALMLNKSLLALDVEADNIAAIDFYRQRGFTVAKHFASTASMQQLGLGAHLHMIKSLT